MTSRLRRRGLVLELQRIARAARDAPPGSVAHLLGEVSFVELRSAESGWGVRR